MADPVRKQPAGGVLDDDPFFYGTRWISVRLPNGGVLDRRVPLTPDDLLDPKLGDEVPESDQHYRMSRALTDLLDGHFASREDVKVVGDMKILWGIPDLSEPAPDVAVIPGIRDKDKDRRSFDVRQEGTRPCLVLEVVSSEDAETRRNDYEKKVPIYEQAGIPEYLICDPPTRFTRDRLLLTGYRLGAHGRYQRIEPDRRGYLLSTTTGLLFGVAEDGRTLRVIDAATGTRLLTGAEAAREAVERARAAEERARNEAEARKAAEAENARLRAGSDA